MTINFFMVFVVACAFPFSGSKRFHPRGSDESGIPLPTQRDTPRMAARFLILSAIPNSDQTMAGNLPAQLKARPPSAPASGVAA